MRAGKSWRAFSLFQEKERDFLCIPTK